jgi:ribosomal-protein-alanine N-acetyltransferase
MPGTPVLTERLELRPLSARFIRALMESTDAFTKQFGLPPAPGLRDFVLSDEVSPEYLARLDSDPTPDPWTHGFALVHRAEPFVVGMAGFKGPPSDDGIVELAYGIVPAYQSKGLATEAARALLAFAFNTPGVRLVRAHTLPTANASTRVLSKCGFEPRGEVIDPEDGRVWRWEKTRDAKQ